MMRDITVQNFTEDAIHVSTLLSDVISRDVFFGRTSSITRYTLGFLDATVFTAHSVLLKVAMSSLSTVVNLGPHNVGHVQVPILHSNTSVNALSKHRRILEDHFLSAGLDFTHSVAVYVQKPPDAPASDRRGGIHPALAICSTHRNVTWTPPDMVGPVSLVRVSDMLGYDPESRPGATARVEQIFG